MTEDVDEAGADGEDDVGARGQLRSGELALAEVVAIRDGALAVGGHDDRGLQQLRERLQFVPGAGAEDTAAGVDERRLGLAEEFGGAVDQVGIAGGALARTDRGEECDLGLGEEGVGRDLEFDGAGATGAELAE